MTIIRSIALFIAAAAIAEIGGAWLVWRGVREHRGLLWIGPVIKASFKSLENFHGQGSLLI